MSDPSRSPATTTRSAGPRYDPLPCDRSATTDLFGANLSRTDPAATGARLCGWCERPIRSGSRSDSKFCGTPCRQAAHRHGKERTLRPFGGRAIRLAYADPPYLGLARKYYRDEPEFSGEVDHAELVSCLQAYDGWALSCSSASLPIILPLCPPGIRVAAWFRGERPTVAYRPLVAWEPVIYHGGRAYRSDVDARRLDALVRVARPRRTDGRRLIGAKPGAFCFWLFDLLGALPGDQFYDLFPGSLGVTRAWEHFSSSRSSATPTATDSSESTRATGAVSDLEDATGAVAGILATGSPAPSDG